MCPSNFHPPTSTFAGGEEGESTSLSRIKQQYRPGYGARREGMREDAYSVSGESEVEEEEEDDEAKKPADARIVSDDEEESGTVITFEHIRHVMWPIIYGLRSSRSLQSLRPRRSGL